MTYDLKHTGEAVDAAVSAVESGSVVVENTLSALDKTSNKPVDSKGIAEAIAQATNSIDDKLTQLEQKAKASECVNLIYGMSTIDGFYNNLGELKGTDAGMFVAAENAISIVPNNIYVYVGDLYAQIHLVFLGENNEVIDTFGKGGGIEALREISYVSSDGQTHYTFVALIAPKGATKMLVSSLRTNIPLSLYSLGTGVDFQSSIDNIYTELHRLGTPIEKSSLYKGRFLKGAKGEALTYGENGDAACIQLPIKEGNSIFVKSTGNAAAPPILWVDANNEIIDIPSTSSVNGRYVAPAKTEYCCVNLFPFSKDFEAHYISAETTELFNRVSILEETVCPYIGWTLPGKFYSIVGLEKSIYLDNIVLQNDDAPSFVLQINKSFGTATNKYFRYTPTEVGQRTLAIDAWDSNNKKVDTKSIIVEAISNTISSAKTICCIGDSITEKYNMPYYIESCLDRVLSETSARPSFVGTKGGESGMGGKPTRHEGWYGRTYGWLATDSESPLVNPSNGQIDIAYYRSVLGLENKIDVVSLAMGYNGTATVNQSEQSFAAIQKIITAFKADNANTKFIVHLVTYPATGNVLLLDEQERIDKKNSLHYFRQLCLNAYGNGQDGNIMIGDLGLVYDRWYAYPRRKESPASYYPSDSVEVVTDLTHPSDEGTKQIAEGIAPCILKMMQ